ncbi:LysR family transcriptional regulator [Shewanella gaetbuli]|uniref:LysR family transcriptional regulator n=1 Tax=Shewanella gaetbuli TaxID=220752 RepID=A0A9X1ZVI4_9GAMM|nr:LysR family transcriptional regulator [Shewanella gaetbuli]MCL1143121.1 LysR family transcriptional regulator [Shewanella gaetbuli]
MDLNALSVFVTLYKSGSTQRAAVILGRSQSYVSKTLAQLRQDLGDPLFIRTANGFQPTTYAIQIAPKIQLAIEQINSALEPEKFNPMHIEHICIHVVEPMLVIIGKSLVETIREKTNAIIELRHWRKQSNALLIDGTVDIGIHGLKERPQQLYQKKIAQGSATLSGNLAGEYVKLLVEDYNEHIELHKSTDHKLDATILVDNYVVLNQLLEQHYTYKFQLPSDNVKQEIGVDIALICNASRRHEQKIKWLSNICQNVIQQAIQKP